jgi:hypothetical protein
MRYQLVLQFPVDSLADYDSLVALEDELIVVLRGSAKVDGHDTGSGETNVFIHTSDPIKTFQQVIPILRRRSSLQMVTAAYRELDGEKYIVIWPENSASEFKLV